MAAGHTGRRRSFLGDILNFFGLDFSEDVEDLLVEAVIEAVEEEVPAQRPAMLRQARWAGVLA